MSYSAELIQQLEREHSDVTRALDRLQLTTIKAGYSLTSPRAKEHLIHGAGRRVKVLRRCLNNVFKLFPPSQTMPLESDDLSEVQVSLHAFVMNLYGVFENLAWTFVIRHSLEDSIGDYRRVGMFLRSTQRHLPPELRDYLVKQQMVTWHDDYLKNYRDALAHRIPLYIPPSRFTDADAQRHNAIEHEVLAEIQRCDWERVELLQREQDALGVAYPMFIHSFHDERKAQPVYLHPQMICDIKTVIEFCELYFTHWDRRAP